MPGTLVSIGWNGPPLACPGFRSNVSSWLGPPLIHKRMHERLRCGLLAACSASPSSQPDVEEPTTPAAASFSHARRLRMEDILITPHGPEAGCESRISRLLNPE